MGTFENSLFFDAPKVFSGEFFSLFSTEEVMGKTKVLTAVPQKEELKITDTITLIYSTVSNLRDTEAVIQRCSVKKVFLEILQNLQENTCARVSF